MYHLKIHNWPCNSILAVAFFFSSFFVSHSILASQWSRTGHGAWRVTVCHCLTWIFAKGRRQAEDARPLQVSKTSTKTAMTIPKWSLLAPGCGHVQSGVSFCARFIQCYSESLGDTIWLSLGVWAVSVLNLCVKTSQQTGVISIY